VCFTCGIILFELQQIYLSFAAIMWERQERREEETRGEGERQERREEGRRETGWGEKKGEEERKRGRAEGRREERRGK
jgi:hypothetical protein